jgi:Yip1 domain
MTESAASTTPAAPPQASFWEDLIDIFYQPVAVFRRRIKGNAWAPYLFVVIAMGIITYATFPAIQPAIDGDTARMLPKVAKQYPQVPVEQLQAGIERQTAAVRYFGAALFGLIVLADGFFVWLLGKMFGAVADFGAAMLIASYAFLPRVLGAVIGGAEGLLMDPSKLRSAAQLTLGPARFLDPDTADPVTVALLSRLDLTIVWQTALLAIGLAVIGRVSRGKAVVFAITIWLVGSLYLLRSAYLIS